MGHLDQTSKNQSSTQLKKYASSDKECEPTTPEPIHSANTEPAKLIFEVIEE